MNKEEFMQIIENWPDLHFTAIKKIFHNGLIEIYAVDTTSQTQSRLHIISTSDAQNADEIISIFQSWLDNSNKEKSNILKDTPKNL